MRKSVKTCKKINEKSPKSQIQLGANFTTCSIDFQLEFLTKNQRKTFPIPIFIFGFIAAAALSSTEVLTDGFLDTISEIRNFLITAAMFGLGAGIRLNSIKGLGIKPLLLGSLSWVTLLVLAGFGTLIEIQFD